MWQVLNKPIQQHKIGKLREQKLYIKQKSKYNTKYLAYNNSSGRVYHFNVLYIGLHSEHNVINKCTARQSDKEGW